jgi:hypothetical protein
MSESPFKDVGATKTNRDAGANRDKRAGLLVKGNGQVFSPTDCIRRPCTNRDVCPRVRGIGLIRGFLNGLPHIPDHRSGAGATASRPGPVTMISATSDHLPPATVYRVATVSIDNRAKASRISGTSLTDRINRPEILESPIARRTKSPV